MKDITGNKYGKLTVSGKAGKNKEGRVKWLCVCDCGGSGTYYKNNLDAGRNHCGCEANKKPNLSHGLRYHELYSIWSSMMNRCENPKSKDFSNYGGRGIKVCARWKNVRLFIEDMHPRPDGMSIDRIDNDLGYTAQNCRWANKSTQMINRRITSRLSCGESVSEIAKKMGVDSRTIYMRKYRGWTDDEIINGKSKAEK